MKYTHYFLIITLIFLNENYKTHDYFFTVYVQWLTFLKYAYNKYFYILDVHVSV